MVTDAIPLIGMDWFTVSRFAPERAISPRMLDRTPG